jgi:alpha-tubulin suppressor-like RCC1 family protein
VIGVSAGDGYTGILEGDGTVWVWGVNQFGELGNGTLTTNPTPMQVSGLSNVTLFAARDYHSMARKADGSLWAWGSGDQGELGDCQFALSTRPVQVMLPPLDQPAIVSPLIVTGSIGLPFTYTISATGCAPIAFGAAGLPGWASLNGSIISGTPDITATSIVTLTANSSFGNDLQLMQIDIGGQPHYLFLPLVMK